MGSVPVVNLLRPLALPLALLACQAPAREGPAPRPEEAIAAKPAAQSPAKPAAQAEPTLARVREDVPHPLTRFLGQPVDAVQSRLGQPLGKGMARETCVRFVPERVFFRCGYALQRYEDPTGTFAAVRVTYEDGVAAAVAFDGWKAGSGPFDPAALLQAIGLELPEPGKLERPDADVRLWTWFNHLARLRVNGRQYRVEMSVVGDDWSRSRVEVLLNDPLTDAQKAAVVPPREAPAELSEPPGG